MFGGDEDSQRKVDTIKKLVRYFVKKNLYVRDRPFLLIQAIIANGFSRGEEVDLIKKVYEVFKQAQLESGGMRVLIEENFFGIAKKNSSNLKLNLLVMLEYLRNIEELGSVYEELCGYEYFIQKSTVNKDRSLLIKQVSTVIFFCINKKETIQLSKVDANSTRISGIFEECCVESNIKFINNYSIDNITFQYYLPDK